MSENTQPTTISFDDFIKADIRTGMIIKAERVPKSDKLLRLEVGFGPLGTRTIVAGIGKSFEPEALLGFEVLAVVNLEPRKVFGIESHGMILAAAKLNGALALATCGDTSTKGPCCLTVAGTRVG